MATRSNIGIEREDGTVETIYCHWDGYPDHQGPILSKFGWEEVEDLLDLGDLSILGEKIFPTTETHNFAHPEPGVCLFYCRDRGEEYSGASLFENRQDAFREEWLYLYVEKEDKWIYTSNGREWKYL